MCKIPQTGYSESGRMGVACDDLGSECLVSSAFCPTFPESRLLFTLSISQTNELIIIYTLGQACSRQQSCQDDLRAWHSSSFGFLQNSALTPS